MLSHATTIAKQPIPEGPPPCARATSTIPPVRAHADEHALEAKLLGCDAMPAPGNVHERDAGDIVHERTEAAAVFTGGGGAAPGPMSDPSSRPDDDLMAAQFERIIRRVKHSMNYRGSYSTRDILGSLVVRWMHSGEWQRLKHLAPEERRIGESVRRFILDRLDQVRRRGEREELIEDRIELPDEVALAEMVEAAELREWIEARIADLRRGIVDERVLIPMADAAQTGEAMRLHLEGRTQRQIASALGISLGLANKRIVEGTNYLVVLHGIEQGIGVGS